MSGVAAVDRRRRPFRPGTRPAALAPLRDSLSATPHRPGGPGQALIAEQFRRAFPDLEWRVDLLVGEGDLVAARWTATGTHSGLGRGGTDGKACDVLGPELLSLRRQRKGRR